MTEEREILDIQKTLSDGKTSSVRKYQDLVVGNRSFASLLKYEFICTLFGGIPGALGLALRRLTYPLLLGTVGRNVTFGTHVVLRHPYKISIGDNVVIDDNCLLDAKGDDDKGLTIGNDVILSRGTLLICKHGGIRIGDRANIGTNCLMGSMSQLDVGSDTLIAANCYVGGGRYHMDRTDLPVAAQGSFTRGPVVIGDGCWLGASAVVIDGVRLGRDVVMGAGAVAVSDLPDFAVAVGVPARVVRVRGQRIP